MLARNSLLSRQTDAECNRPRRSWRLVQRPVNYQAPRPRDYCFRDLRAKPIVRWPGEPELTIGSDCEDWVIYDMEDAGVCVERWTAPPNSLNMLNPHIVSPDVPLVASMIWTWR
jgi:aldose 1-epimerase